MYTTETVYNDMDIAQMKAIAPTALHRPVDMAVVEADLAGYIRGHIVTPGLIYGAAQNVLVDAGVSSSRSKQVPVLVLTALTRGRTGMVGAGKAVWPAVDVDDSE